MSGGAAVATVESIDLRDAALLVFAARSVSPRWIVRLRGRHLWQDPTSGALFLQRVNGDGDLAQMKFAALDQEVLLEYAESWSVWGHPDLPLFRGNNGGGLTERHIFRVLAGYRTRSSS